MPSLPDFCVKIFYSLVLVWYFGILDRDARKPQLGPGPSVDLISRFSVAKWR
jgi:hypothetical protein